MKTKNKLLIPILSLGLLFTANSEISYADTTDGMDKYYQMIDDGKILPPQYEDEDGKLMTDKILNSEDWKEEVKKQQYGMGADNTVLINRDLNKVTINKKDDRGNPVSGVTFRIYWTKEDMDNDKNHVLEGQTDGKGKLTFDLSKNEDFKYYGFYVKETNAPKGYIMEEDEHVYFYKDNGVRFLGEIKVSDLTPKEAEGKKDKNGEDLTLNTYLQDLVDLGKVYVDKTQAFNNDTNWLVFNDNGTEKLVSKKPLKYKTTWNGLYSSGVVFGKETLGELDTQEKRNEIFEDSSYYGIKTNGDVDEYKPQYVEINGKRYIVRLMRAYNEKAGINDDKKWGDPEKPWDRHHPEIVPYVKGSEWNRLILPLIDPNNGRFGYIPGNDNTKLVVENNMPTLANYSWWTDFGGKDNGVNKWAQETGYDGNKNRAYRGNKRENNAAAQNSTRDAESLMDSLGWLPVLEEVETAPFDIKAGKGMLDVDGNQAIDNKDFDHLDPKIQDINDNLGEDANFYTGEDGYGKFTAWKYGENEDIQNNEELKELYKGRAVKFYGETDLTNLSTNIKGGTDKDSLEDKGTNNLNDYLKNQVTKDVGDGKYFNNNTTWLVFKDTDKDGKEVEKLVSKKPLKYNISWNDLYSAGVLFDEKTSGELEDQKERNKIFENNNNKYFDRYSDIKTNGNINKYNPQYVEINSNKYIVRLIRAYSDDTPINDRTKKFGSYEKTKGSEWDRLILPLISPPTVDKNEVYQYKSDYNEGINGRFGNDSKEHVEKNMPTLANYSWWTDFGGNNNNSGIWDKSGSYGVYRWTQEESIHTHSYKSFRGDNTGHNAATASGDHLVDERKTYMGWLPVLERVD